MSLTISRDIDDAFFGPGRIIINRGTELVYIGFHRDTCAGAGMNLSVTEAKELAELLTDIMGRPMPERTMPSEA